MLRPMMKSNFQQLFVVCRRCVSRKRTKSIRNLVSEQMKISQQKQLFDYFLVLDFEATCDNTSVGYENEIIEFPIFKVNSATFEIEDSFHSFVRPTVNPLLTNFCSKLTGISQENVDNKPDLNEVLKLFHCWLKSSFSENKNFIFITSGDWDLMDILPRECSSKDISLPNYFYSYININKSFAHAMGVWPRQNRSRLLSMLRILDLEFVGELHQGTSDCHNIIRIAKALAERGHVFKPTTKLPYRSV